MGKKKVLLMFSGGLDSRVSAKFMGELGFEVELFYVSLPFNSVKKDDASVREFSEKNGFKFNFVNAKKGDLFQEYLSFLRKPKYGVGAAVNPCKDCKIFIFKLVKDFFEKSKGKYDIIASGEVLGQRPMSQVKRALLFDDKKAGMEGKILRPLSAKVLGETVYEKEGLVNREDMLGLVGRRREVQMKLAEKYGIEYPSAAGGCLLCDKSFGVKLKKLFEIKSNEEINYELISLLKFGRMFVSKGLIFVGRNEEENNLIKKLNEKLCWKIYFNPKVAGPTILYENVEDSEIIEEIWGAYSDKNSKMIWKFSELRV